MKILIVSFPLPLPFLRDDLNQHINNFYRGKMSTTITIIRHAPTVQNKKGIFMGTEDIPVDQQEFVSDSFISLCKNENICLADCIFTSPLQRARSTAEAIAKNEAKRIIIDDRLIERHLGDWQGMPKTQVHEKYPDAFINEKMDFFYTPQNGEPYDVMVKRVADFLVDRCYENRKLLIVTHNGIFRVMKSLLTGKGLSNVFQTFEPHLVPETFFLEDYILDRIRSNPFYTVDK